MMEFVELSKLRTPPSVLENTPYDTRMIEDFSKEGILVEDEPSDYWWNVELVGEEGVDLIVNNSLVEFFRSRRGREHSRSEGINTLVDFLLEEVRDGDVGVVEEDLLD